MHLLPVAERELRVASRRGRTYWGRFAMGAGAMLVGGWMWLTFSFGGGLAPGMMGMRLFAALATVAFIHSVVAGVYSVDAISREKREGTLGLLFLTDLRGLDVLAGKLVATGIHALLALAAVVPVLAVCLLAGGISGQVLWRTVLVLLNVLLLSLAGGLLVSAFSRDARKAGSGLVLLMLMLCVGLPYLGYLETQWVRKVDPSRVHPLFVLPSPIMAYASAVSSGPAWGGTGLGNPYWWCMGTLHGLTWLFLAVAALVIPRVWQERGSTSWWSPVQRAWHWVVFGDREHRKRRRRRLLDLNPICWLSSRERWRTPAIWGLLLLALGGWLFGWHKLGRDWLTPPVGIATALCLHGLFKYWLAAEACRRFAEDRENGAFELVLSTSLTVRQILWGRWLALMRSFGGAWLAMLLIDLGLLTGGLQVTVQAGDRRALVIVFLVGIAFLVMHFIALGWVGMWRGLTARTVNQALSLTVSQVMVWPWLMFGLLWAALLLAGELWGFGFQPMRFVGLSSFWTGFLLWVMLMLALNLGATFWARRRLLRDFRLLATQRFEIRRTRWWGWLGGGSRSGEGRNP